ncbi:hypothetical protein M758_7G034300 [Ceratodon purpureus]|nr:hypothetical protein M758_7G034300 [Ceratodon purpureus]
MQHMFCPHVAISCDSYLIGSCGAMSNTAVTSGLSWIIVVTGVRIYLRAYFWPTVSQLLPRYWRGLSKPKWRCVRT